MRFRARLAVGLLVALGLVAACGGSPPDLGVVRPSVSAGDWPNEFKVVTIEGMTMDAAPIEPVHVEVAGDGASMTVFFLGGDPSCYAVAGVEVDRSYPEAPRATVLYGLRLGVVGCNAALAGLAIEVPLDPPIER